MVYNYKDLKITWLGHDSFKVEYKGKYVYFDPYKIKPQKEKADYILISHNHFDHLSPEDINKVLSKGTVLIAPTECKDELEKFKENKKYYVKPGDELSFDLIKVKAVNAYNVNKFRAPGVVFHPKEDNKVGYVVTFGETSIYHAGDTDHIPEMKNLKPTIALLPVSGTYVMTKEEAIEAAKDIKPKIVIPMHYGTIVGSEADAEYLKGKLPKEIELVILKPE
jgi:L-ascorbate metabolism protein UlaG (beta-lactamase superfamily)